ncbi:hypothetical protein CHX26_07695 [Porphyrobacter sp. HT-58-2]|uniref:hypothetical protein n=1 Tax=Porphyrobacter sp. HT-58-2 TaxID=2023229 RepID=UPI000CDC6C63|nr:hypothetical protein [Porphyrobacter sp. HT-58-2]AUX69392.1 hypothetical protein CHX26_07695 [Porphyrobacter sp. HT-58-2]
MNTIKKPSSNSGCPTGWRDRPKDVSMTKAGYDTCYPDKGAKKAYVRKTQSEACAPGYIGSGAYYCVEGSVTYTASTAGALIKANPLDRCPVGYFTVPSDGNACTSTAANPPKVRRKGDGECGPDEIDDWGLYCVSDYGQLTRKDAAKGYPDYNAIYQNSYRLTGKQQGARQADLPEGKEYTPAYFTIFGRVDRDGNPIPGSGAQAATSVVGAAANPASAAEAAVKQCVPKPKKKKGLGGLLKEAASELGVPTGEGC